MSESFDPYRIWLGIPAESRPPTHYELLGISPNEQDKTVIEAAMLRQSGYVRNFQIGKYGKDAAKILNEIAAAKVCLLDPVKRAKYDAELKTRNAGAAAAAPQALPAPPAAAIDLDQLAGTAAMLPPAAARWRNPQRRLALAPRKRKPTSLAWQIPVAAAAALIFGVVLFVSVRHRDGDEPREQPQTADSVPPADVGSTGSSIAESIEDASEPVVVKGTVLPSSMTNSIDDAAAPVRVDPQATAAVGVDESTAANRDPAHDNNTTSSLDTPLSAAAKKLLAQAVALYRAEGNANDSAGKHHGKLQGDAAITPIRIGHAFTLGGNRVVVIPDAPELNPTEQFTMMAWIRPDALAWTDVLSKATDEDGPKRQGFHLGFSPELTLYGQFNAPGESWSKNQAWGQARSEVGQWLHAATTYDGRLLQLYKDGICVASSEVGRKAICRSDANLIIGGLTASGGLRFKGLIDDVALFDRALVQADIETIYRDTAAGKVRQKSTPPQGLTPERQSLLEHYANGRTIDVLALIDPARDARSGKWTADLEGLHSPRDSVNASLRLPVAVPHEYSLTIVAERSKGWKGTSPILNVGHVATGKQFNSTIDWNGTAGLERIDGRYAHENESTVQCGNLFEDGRTSVVTYIVRRSGVEMLFDGRQILNWKGDYRRFSLQDGWRNPIGSPLRLFLGTHCDWHFKAIRLTPLTAAVAAPAAGEKAATDLLKTIDLKKHTRGGWAFDGPVLVSPPNVVHAGVRFPGVVPDEYRLRIVAERPRGFQGPPQFHVGLATRLSQATLVLDADHKSGLEAVGGKMFHENATTFPGDLFIDGVESTIDCTVDKGGIRVAFDGHTIIDWHGDLKQLTPTWSEFGAPKRTFWIGTHCNYRIKKVELLPLTKERASRAEPVGSVAPTNKATMRFYEAFAGQINGLRQTQPIGPRRGQTP